MTRRRGSVTARVSARAGIDGPANPAAVGNGDTTASAVSVDCDEGGHEGNEKDEEEGAVHS